MWVLCRVSCAYDRDPYYRLFCKLLDVGAPVYLVRLLSVCSSNNSGEMKGNFLRLIQLEVSNGVRQGTYLDGLLAGLKKCVYRARLGHMCWYSCICC